MTNSKIKVLQLELDENLGGIETFLLNVYSNIDRDKFQFDFVTRSDNPAKAEELRSLGANIYKVSSYKNPYLYVKDIRTLVENNRYNIIHINKNSAANILPFIAVKKFKEIKVISHSHNTRPSIEGPSKILHEMNRKQLYDLSNIHLACSKEAGIWLYGNKEFKIIPNGIDTLKYKFDKETRNVYRNKLDLNNSFVLLHVGRFTEQKNHTLLIKIFRQLIDKGVDTKLILVGNGPLKNKIEDLVISLKLNDKIIFLENRNDVNKIMMACDCFIMPSLYEGLPFAAIEAQASGLPVYLSNNISRETEITDGCRWFSLSDDITDRIINESNDSSVRIDRNNQVLHSKYSIFNTINALTLIYES